MKTMWLKPERGNFCPDSWISFQALRIYINNEVREDIPNKVVWRTGTGFNGS
jgi:16S rRNA C1402 N4-methylase RsmH